MCGLTPTPLQLSRPQYRNPASLSREECRKGVGADLAKHPDFPAGSHRIALLVAVASSRNLIFGNAQHVSNLLRVNDQLWVWQGRRPHLHVVARLDLARVLQGKRSEKTEPTGFAELQALRSPRAGPCWARAGPSPGQERAGQARTDLIPWRALVRHSLPDNLH